MAKAPAGGRSASSTWAHDARHHASSTHRGACPTAMPGKDATPARAHLTPHGGRPQAMDAADRAMERAGRASLQATPRYGIYAQRQKKGRLRNSATGMDRERIGA